jgi:beta-aspartyl-peptidase (threonine type)
MKKFNLFTALILLVFLSVSCVKENRPTKTQKKQIEFGLIIHGGAGNITPENLPKDLQEKYKAKLKEALMTGYKILKNGGHSLDAVEKVINVMEDSPLFNAGKGAVMTDIGTCELDASIMDGKTLNAGAVAGVKHIKNPITAARKVMEISPHVLLGGDGADQFAKEIGLPIVPNNYFYTPRRLKQYQQYKEKQKGKSLSTVKQGIKKFGTVGCAALDKYGNLAAGTSTGGISFKKFGRIGDSPIIGAGTYTNNQTCAISCTGQGEYFIRNVVAYDISARMAYKGSSLKKAARKVIMDKLVKQKAEGGMIGIDKYGNIVAVFNTPGMFRAFITDKSKAIIKMFK